VAVQTSGLKKTTQHNSIFCSGGSTSNVFLLKMAVQIGGLKKTQHDNIFYIGGSTSNVFR